MMCLLRRSWGSGRSYSRTLNPIWHWWCCSLIFFGTGNLVQAQRRSRRCRKLLKAFVFIQNPASRTTFGSFFLRPPFFHLFWNELGNFQDQSVGESRVLEQRFLRSQSETNRENKMDFVLVDHRNHIQISLHTCSVARTNPTTVASSLFNTIGLFNASKTAAAAIILPRYTKIHDDSWSIRSK